MDKLGATGDFPQGKLNPTDEGGLNIEVRQEDGKVVVEFGKKVRWIGLDPEGAIEFGRLIIGHALAIKATTPHG